MKNFFLIFTFNFLLLTSPKAFAGSSTTYTTDIQFNAGIKENTMVFGTGDSGYVNLTNNFYDITDTPRPSAR